MNDNFLGDGYLLGGVLGSPLSAADRLSPIERTLLDAANGRGCKLFRTQTTTCRALVFHKVNIYRLASEKHHAVAEFTLEPSRATILMLWVAPEHQGSYQRIREFLGLVCKMLFSCGVSRIVGNAAPTRWPTKKRRTLAAQKKALVRFYRRFGFAVDDAGWAILTCPQTSKAAPNSPAASFAWG